MTESDSKRDNGGPFVGSHFREADFLRLRELLVERRGFDLGMYKDQCIKRRIARRVREAGFRHIEPYLEKLAGDEGELDALIAALSIHVSQFFRNPGVFSLIERAVLPALVAAKRRNGEAEIQIWSVGCAGGEETYSLALLCDGLAPVDLHIALLGTDLSPAILQQARDGWFDAARLREVPPALLERYFRAEGRGFRVTDVIRSKVVFREQDILNDPVYPAADLILCRNVMIYFSREDQYRILQRFAEVLPENGYLVLGNAENLLGPAARHFVAEYPAERIYRRI